MANNGSKALETPIPSLCEVKVLQIFVYQKSFIFKVKGMSRLSNLGAIIWNDHLAMLSLFAGTGFLDREWQIANSWTII